MGQINSSSHFIAHSKLTVFSWHISRIFSLILIHEHLVLVQKHFGVKHRLAIFMKIPFYEQAEASDRHRHSRQTHILHSYRNAHIIHITHPTHTLSNQKHLSSMYHTSRMNPVSLNLSLDDIHALLAHHYEANCFLQLGSQFVSS